MGKIVFENAPSTNTPLNAENLNNNFDAMHHIGSIHITTTNTNPSSVLGGTWELIDKEFKELKIDDQTGTYFAKNETNTISFRLYAVRNKKTISCRLNVKNGVELNEDAITLGTFNFEALGITRLYYGIVSGLGATDGGNAAFQFGVQWETGVVESFDIISKTSSSTISSNSSCYMFFELPCCTEYMLDSACDKFYWKRTS